MTGARDPMRLDLNEWTLEDVQSLIGLPESHRREYKGPLLDFKGKWPSAAAKVADAVACLASASGGFLILGAGDGEVFEAFEGTGLDEEAAYRLGRSISDQVEPRPLIHGPRQFLDGDGQDVVVIQVFPDSAGRPHRGPSGYRSRYEDECKRIPTSEVERRLVTAASLAEPATARARGKMHSVLEGRAGQTWLRVIFEPFLIDDLELSGSHLLTTVKGARAKLVSVGLDPDWLQSGNLRTASGGVVLDQPSSFLAVNHAGGIQAAVLLDPYVATTGIPAVPMDRIAADAYQAAILSVLIAREVRPHSPYVVRLMTSGVEAVTIAEPTVGGAYATPTHVFEGPSRAEVEFVASPQVSGLELHERVHLLLTRIREAAGPGGLVAYEWGLEAAKETLG